MSRVVALRPDQPQLVQYERMRTQVEHCARVDEAATIVDDAAALLAYARQRDDIELMAWVSEIHLRAEQKCGELSARIAKATSNQHRNSVDTKQKALADAGLSKMDASRAERLAGYNEETRPRPKDTPAELKERERLFKAGKEASEAYYADAKSAGRVPSRDGLQLAVDTAIAIAAGKPPPRPPALHPDKPIPAALRELASDEVKVSSAALQAVRALNRTFPDAEELAEHLHAKMRRPLIGELKTAIAKLTTALEAIDG